MFTHFDQVKGDNLPNDAARRAHVTASLENAIRAIDESIGAGIGRSMRRSLDGRVFFVGSIDAVLTPQRKGTRAQLVALVDRLVAMIEKPPQVAAVPVYDLGNLVIGAASAARQFQEAWDARLPAEHWTRVKALAKRLGYLHEDEYDTLKPAADLIRVLSEQAWAFIAAPREWRSAKPSEEDAQIAVNQVAREFFGRLHQLVANRLWLTKIADWQTAYDLRGSGSGHKRKRSLKLIYHTAAPVPGVVPVPEATEFLDSLRAVFKEAAIAAGAEVI